MNINNQKKFLVTGGAGFIGTNLCKFLIEKGHIVTSIDNYSSGNKKNHLDNVKYINGNTRNIAKILKDYNIDKIDGVFHLGEYSKISSSFSEYSDVVNSNIKGTAEVIKFCAEKNIKIVYAGSSTKFATEGIMHSPYSLTKSQNVDLIKGCAEWFDLKYSICYFYNNYGPFQDTCNNGYETVISIFEKQKKKNLKLTIVSPGTQNRNYTHVQDTVRGIYKSYFYSKNDEFQLCADKTYNLFELAKLFQQDFVIVEKRKGDRMNGISNLLKKAINDTKLKLNWEAKNNLKTWIDRRKNEK